MTVTSRVLATIGALSLLLYGFAAWAWFDLRGWYRGVRV